MKQGRTAGPMIRALVNGELFRRAFGLAAAVILLIQVLSVGAAVVPAGPQRPVATASGHHDHSGRHPPPQPDSAPHCSWCILCGKLGVAVGAPPAPVAVLLPEATRTEPVAVGGLEQGVGRSYAVLPLGARAPPRLV